MHLQLFSSFVRAVEDTGITLRLLFGKRQCEACPQTRLAAHVQLAAVLLEDARGDGLPPIRDPKAVRGLAEFNTR